MGERSQRTAYAYNLLPYFGSMPVTAITAGTAQEYRVRRMTKLEDWDDEKKPWKPSARNTIHNEIVTLNMVLKTAKRHGWLEHLPNLSDPYRRQTKVQHRPWFTPKEYKQLYEATRENAKNPQRESLRWYAEQLHDFVLLASNTGLRPDELKLLEFRDIDIVHDDFSNKNILEIEVRGCLLYTSDAADE